MNNRQQSILGRARDAQGRVLPGSGLPLAERFAAKVNKNGPLHPVLKTRCHVWTGAINKKTGYGAIGVGKKTETAPRVAYLLKTGSLPPKGFDLCHRCDYRPCVNFEHLFVGTRSDNMRDCSAKGRLGGATARRVA